LSNQVLARVSQSFDEETPFDVRELIPHFTLIKEKDAQAPKDQPASTAK